MSRQSGNGRTHSTSTPTSTPKVTATRPSTPELDALKRSFEAFSDPTSSGLPYADER